VIVSIPSLGVAGDLWFHVGIIVIVLGIAWTVIGILVCLKIIEKDE
jgi:Flp pilus assembly protein TadB